jgi:hypothetical protein
MTLGKAARDDTTSEFFDAIARGEFLIMASWTVIHGRPLAAGEM